MNHFYSFWNFLPVKYQGGNVLNYVQKILEIEKGHGKKVCVDQNTDLHPSGGNHDPWQEV